MEQLANAKALGADRDDVHRAVGQMRALDDTRQRADRVWIGRLGANFLPLAN